MSQSTAAMLIIILIMVVLLVLALFGSNLLMRRAIKQVINLLRRGDALTPQSAKLADELGIKRQMFQFRLLRDFKPQALNLLVNANIVMTTEDGRIYLSEEALSKTKLVSRQ